MGGVRPASATACAEPFAGGGGVGWRVAVEASGSGTYTFSKESTNDRFESASAGHDGPQAADTDAEAADSSGRRPPRHTFA